MTLLTDNQKVFTRNIALLIAFAWENNFQLAFGEVARTREQQKIYVDSGRSLTMNSRHIQRLAADFTIWHQKRLLFAPGIDRAAYGSDLIIARPLGEYWESLHANNVWGADWNRNNIDDERLRDPYHFEMKP